MNITDFLNKGMVSSPRTTEKYVSKHFPVEYIKLKEWTNKINLKESSFSEELYHYLNHIEQPIVCKNCNHRKPKFKGLLHGYSGYCSSKCSNSSDEVKNTKEKSCLAKYGVTNPSKAPEVIDKIQKTFDKNYGGNPFTIKKFQDQIRNTNIKRFGTPSPMSNGSTLRDQINEKLMKKFTTKYIDLELISVDFKKWGIASFRCKACNEIFEISKWNLHQRTLNNIIDKKICTKCNPVGSSKITTIENFIRNILDENNILYKERDRKILDGKEIDFLLSELKIGIEVNGLYWHSTLFQNKNYHENKTILAEKKGYLLIHVFEDEIINKPEIVKSRLLSILNIYKETIYARKCVIKKLASKECNDFLINNHLQGASGAKERLGLYYKEKLISVMTFGVLRKNLGNKKQTGSWELIRFCNLKGYKIIGGASKLLKYFILDNKPKNIISYCDARWSNGNFYEKIGFKKNYKTQPNYWYIKNTKREQGFKYRKDQLVLQGFDIDKTEAIIMMERGFLRIYDCGSYRFEMNL